MEGEKYSYTLTRDLTEERLMEDIAYELTDPDFEGRIHGRNDVYRDGCRGPLCRYRERTRKREARDAKTRASLPGSIQPVRRTRCEQRWDDVIEETLDQIKAVGARQWLDSRNSKRIVVPVSNVAGPTVLGSIHTEGGESCREAVALHLLQAATARMPIQRVDEKVMRS